MATKRVTLKDIPTSQINMIVGRFHVGAPDEEIVAEIERGAASWPPAARKLAIKYALDRHHKNARLATDIALGRIGRGRASGKSRADAIVEIRHARYVEPGDTIGGSDGNAWRVLRFVGPNRAEVVLGNWDDVSDDESGGSTPRALVES